MGVPKMTEEENANPLGSFATTVQRFTTDHPIVATTVVATAVTVTAAAVVYQQTPTVPVRAKHLEGNEDRSQWMKDIDDETLLRDMSIPGTHDSVTGEKLEAGLYSCIDRQTAQCQRKGIAGQLNDGIRFLDIRLKFVEKTVGKGKKQSKKKFLTLIHGMATYGEDFASVLNECTSFLKKNKKETIFMSIKNEDLKTNENFVGKLNGELSLKKSYIARFEEVKGLKLRDCRGKIVIFKRFTDKNLGTSHKVAGFDLNSEVWDSAQKEENKYFSIHDDFQGITRAEKAKKVFAHLQENKGTSEKLKITFNSLSFLTYKFILGHGSPYSNACKLNKLLLDNLKNANSQENKLGIIVLDFYDCIGEKSDFSSDLVSKIIEMNPRK